MSVFWGSANEIIVVFKQSTGQNGAVHPPTVTRFYFLREHRMHGIVTGVESIKIMASLGDKLDRLLVSFKDAKVGECAVSEVYQPHILLSACPVGMV